MAKTDVANENIEYHINKHYDHIVTQRKAYWS